MKKRILKINNMCKEIFSESLLEKAACTIFSEEEVGKSKQISLTLVSPDVMRELNLKYKGRDSLTDVLAFPLQGEVGPARKILGEVVVCPQVAKTQAEQRGHTLEEELVLLTIHGILHLLGYRDEKEGTRRVMEDKERKILRRLGKKENIV